MTTPIRRALPDARWEDVPVTEYKPAGSAPFHGVTRQTLVDDPALACEWRYFEIAPGGWSTLERHQHAHAVMVLRGRGRCLVGDRIHPVGEHDLVRIDSDTWHQFRADDDAPLGFLCLVNRDRDRPRLPDASEFAALCADPTIAAFVRRGEPDSGAHRGPDA